VELASEQLRKLRRRQALGTLEQAKNKNSKNLQRARAFALHDVALDATRIIPLVISGRGCEISRVKIAGGWTPGPTFATHGDVGFNSLCSPSAMREWLAAFPGAYLDRLDHKRAWSGGVVISTGRRLDSTTKIVTAAGSVSVPSLSTMERIAELTPNSAETLVVPAWLTQFAEAAPAGEEFWA
jgi:hypothetical protein